MTEFKIRSYGKSELAMMYFPLSAPHTATNHLMAWIRRNRQLSAALEAMGYSRQSKCFTPKEVRAIVEVLGEP